MNNLIYLLLKLLLVLLGALFIKFAVDNYNDKRYWLFGFDLFVVIDYAIMLFGLHLAKWEGIIQ